MLELARQGRIASKSPESRGRLATTQRHQALAWRRWNPSSQPEWLTEELENPIARHMLAACTGRDVPNRASNGFIEATFDTFASSFESKLERLSYRAPALVAAMLDDAGVQPSHYLDVLDAGCGTGLCGAILAPFAHRLVGVDLSEGMLAHAKAKNVYHELVKAELTEYLGGHSEALDLIVSADTLVYFGDLKGVIAALAGALRPNGLMIFTLEHAVGDRCSINYCLELHGRYSHAQAYVKRLLTCSGLRSSRWNTIGRKNRSRKCSRMKIRRGFLSPTIFSDGAIGEWRRTVSSCIANW